MNRQTKIDVATFTVLLGFVVGIAQNTYLYYKGFVESIYMYVISKPGMFDDFTNVIVYIRNNDPYALKTAVVSPFPFLFRLHTFFLLFPLNVAIVVYLAIFLGAFFYYVYGAIKTSSSLDTLKNVLILTFFSYPFLFSMNRGNSEMMIFLIIGFFIKWYSEGKRGLSFIALMIALAIKPFPVVFLALYFADKRYREMIAIAVSALAITLASYATFHGGFMQNYREHHIALNLYNTDYAIGNGGMTYGHSLFGLIKILIAHFSPANLHAYAAVAFGYYGKAIVVWAALSGLYVAFVEKIFWRRIAILIIMMDLFPFVSADYKLLYFYIPLFLLINDGRFEKADLWFLLLFALLLVPKSYYYNNFDPAASIVPYVVNTAAIINPVLMIIGYFGIVYLGISKKWGRRSRMEVGASHRELSSH